MRIETTGFFELQVNGFAGVDFNDPRMTLDDLRRATAALRATGVTRFLPTIITGSFERFAACAKTLARFTDPANAGIHMEGPYIGADDGPRGAHPREHVRAAAVDDFRRRQEAAEGRIVLVTLAPEVEGALALIEYLVSQKVLAAIGHTAATTEQVRDAVKAGATLSTHLGNGCGMVLPRHSNFIWEQLASDELYASFITDGHHLAPSTVKVMVRAKTLPRSILVTDAVAAAGCAPGRYELGGVEVELSADGRVIMPKINKLAGSALTMDKAVANTVKFTGLSLDEVLPMASTTPAACIGMQPAGKITADWDATTGTFKIISVNS